MYSVSEGRSPLRRRAANSSASRSTGLRSELEPDMKPPLAGRLATLGPIFWRRADTSTRSGPVQSITANGPRLEAGGESGEAVAGRARSVSAGLRGAGPGAWLSLVLGSRGGRRFCLGEVAQSLQRHHGEFPSLGGKLVHFALDLGRGAGAGDGTDAAVLVILDQHVHLPVGQRRGLDGDRRRRTRLGDGLR